MRFYIDRITGTWGDANDLCFIDVEPGAEEAMLINTLDGKSDAEIVRYGLDWGYEADICS